MSEFLGELAASHEEMKVRADAGDELVRELLEAMERYDMDTDDDPPFNHSDMMRRARAHIDGRTGSEPLGAHVHSWHGGIARIFCACGAWEWANPPSSSSEPRRCGQCGADRHPWLTRLENDAVLAQMRQTGSEPGGKTKRPPPPPPVTEIVNAPWKMPWKRRSAVGPRPAERITPHGFGHCLTCKMDIPVDEWDKHVASCSGPGDDDR